MSSIALPSFTRDLWEIALRRKIAEQEAVRDLYGEDWPENFDPNDIALYQMVLSQLQEATPCTVSHLESKPVMLSVGVLVEYLSNPAFPLSAAQTQEIHALLDRIAHAPKVCP